MTIGTISNIYLLIFLPLISALLCQIFYSKIISFLTSLLACCLIGFLLSKIFPDILIYEKINNDYGFSLLSLALEFRVDILSITFLMLIILLESLTLIFYRFDVKSSLDSRNQCNFYSVFLLKIFSLIGIMTSNNLLNLYLFIEIHSFALFAIASISYDKKLLNLSFRNFCLNASSSMLILISFFAIYLVFGELNFEKITDNFVLLPAEKTWFLFLISILVFIAFIIKFFPLWQYFEKIKSNSSITNFLIVDSLFIKTLVGIFLSLKFIYFFFGNNFLFIKYNFAPIFIFIGLVMIFYSSYQLINQKHLKLICAFSVINNLGFIIATVGLQTSDSLQGLFFFLLNFALINFFIFIFASFLKKQYSSSSIDNLWQLNLTNPSASLALKMIIAFIASFPMTFLFFGYWFVALTSLEIGFKLIMIFALALTNYSQISIATKILQNLFLSKETKFIAEKKVKNSSAIQVFTFWILITVIYIMVMLSSQLNTMSLRFASFLLSNTI